MTPIVKWLGPWAKTVTALVVGLLGWASIVISSDSNAVTANEWVILGTVLATALGVYAIPNTTPDS